MVKRISKIALALLVSGPLLAGCAKSPFATDASSSTDATMAGADGRGYASAAGGAAGAYGQGNAAARPNPREFTQSAQLRDIRFEFDRYDIRAEDAEVLDANAESLKANPKILILIEGHADQRGTAEYNLALADRRAKASMNYLVSRGVRSNRISIISYGKERPMCAEANEGCWSQNRRAHFLVKGQ
jgi:peptidoglycan-associated lipoprotein